MKKWFGICLLSSAFLLPGMAMSQNTIRQDIERQEMERSRIEQDNRLNELERLQRQQRRDFENRALQEDIDRRRVFKPEPHPVIR